jgi:hypothetical protein
MLGVNLLVYATSRKKYMDARVQDDEDVNKFGRNPIGEGKDEQVRHSKVPELCPDRILGVQSRIEDAAESQGG